MSEAPLYFGRLLVCTPLFVVSSRECRCCVCAASPSKAIPELLLGSWAASSSSPDRGLRRSLIFAVLSKTRSVQKRPPDRHFDRFFGQNLLRRSDCGCCRWLRAVSDAPYGPIGATPYDPLGAPSAHEPPLPPRQAAAPGASELIRGDSANNSRVTMRKQEDSANFSVRFHNVCRFPRQEGQQAGAGAGQRRACGHDRHLLGPLRVPRVAHHGAMHTTSHFISSL